MGFEDPAYFTRFFGLDAACLEFDAVEFDGEDEGGGAALLNAFGDAGYDACAVCDGAAVGVCAEVCGLGEELGEEVAWGC